MTETELAEGANLNVVSLELNSGRPVKAHVLDIDLSKEVDIVAGSYNDLTSATGKNKTSIVKFKHMNRITQIKKLLARPMPIFSEISPSMLLSKIM